MKPTDSCLLEKALVAKPNRGLFIYLCMKRHDHSESIMHQTDGQTFPKTHNPHQEK